MLALALRSLWNRRFVASLTVLSIAMSVALILGVERLRGEARDSFTNSASGIDMIVAPRANPVQILMATVFGVGTTGTGLTWETYEQVDAIPQVAWSVPILMGDNHRGYPVIGTTADYFRHFRHTGGQELAFSAGEVFADAAPDLAVVGAEVALRFGYSVGSVIVNAHGSGEVSFDLHEDAPFTISGILAPTGTAVDRMVFVSLAGFDEVHAARTPAPVDPFHGIDATDTPPNTDGDHHSEPGHADEAGRDHADHGSEHGGPDHADVDHTADHDTDEHAHHAPDRINAIYLGLSQRNAVLTVQQSLVDLRTDPVSAVIPAVALAELWSITGTAERAMQIMAWAVGMAGITGMVVMLSATLESRRREFAILRSVGATPGRILSLILAEAALLLLAGCLAGLVILAIAFQIAGPVLAARFGLFLDLSAIGMRDFVLLAIVLAVGLAASLVPAVRVYRTTLSDGLSVRL